MTQTQSNTTTNTNTTQQCYSHRHMPAVAYAVHNVCLSWSRKSGILYFDGPKIAAQFEKMSKSTAYRCGELLQERGWFILLKDKERRWDGTWSPRHYRVLTHEEWTEQHPGQCKAPVSNEGMDDLQPVSNSALPVSNSVQPVSNSSLPVAGEGKNLYIKPINKLIREPIPVQPVAGEGMDVSVFLDRFSKSKKRRRTEYASDGFAESGTQAEYLDYGRVGNNLSRSQGKLEQDNGKPRTGTFRRGHTQRSHPLHVKPKHSQSHAASRSRCQGVRESLPVH
jgi:hypothetical protein